MARAASATLFTGFGPPGSTGLGDLRLGVEVGDIPSLNTSERTVGFDGTKEEDLNKVPVVVRPRLAIGLPLDLTLEVAYIPPISIGGARPNLLSAAVGRPVVELGAFRLGLRAYGQAGTILGDFTCSQADVAGGTDANRNPYGCEETSDDRITMYYVGLELGAAYRIAALHHLEIHLAAAGNYLNLAFQVNARYSGIVDSSRLTTQGATFSTTGGLAMPLVAGLNLAVDGFYSPLFVDRPNETKQDDGLFNVRGLVEYRFDL